MQTYAEWKEYETFKETKQDMKRNEPHDMEKNRNIGRYDPEIGRLSGRCHSNVVQQDPDQPHCARLCAVSGAQGALGSRIRFRHL